MECKFAFICDYAERDRKLHAIGIGFDTIFAANLPAVHPMMCFVASLKGTIAEAGTKDISLRLIDNDGDDVIPPMQQQVPFEVKAPSLGGEMNVVIALGGLQFKKYGAYAFHILEHGSELATVSFSVAQPPTSA